MTTTNVNTREPTVLDYASPVQFRFKCSKLPTVELKLLTLCNFFYKVDMKKAPSGVFFLLP